MVEKRISERGNLAKSAREGENGARCRFRTCDPYRVEVMLYH